MTNNGHNKNRMTVQRRVILEELQATRNHPTADELFQRVRGRLPNISLGTVYRNLDFLVKSHRARKIDGAGGQCRFDGDLDRHYHIRCMECGRVDDLTSVNAALFDEAEVTAPGYEVMGFRLEFEGLCPGCSGRHRSDSVTTGKAHRKAQIQTEGRI